MDILMLLVDEHPVATVFFVVGVVALLMMAAIRMGAGSK